MRPYRIRFWYEVPPKYESLSMLFFNGKLAVPGIVKTYRDKSFELTRAWQKYWFALLKQSAPVNWTDKDLVKAWNSLTMSGRAFTNFHGTDKCQNFIAGENLNASSSQMECLTCEGNVVMGDDVPVWMAGGWKIKVYTLDTNAPPDIAKVNRKTRPDLIHLATNDGNIAYADGTYPVTEFPQLSGNDVPFPFCAPGGYDWLDANNLEPVDSLIQNPYHIEAAPTPPPPVDTSLTYREDTLLGCRVHIHTIDISKHKPVAFYGFNSSANIAKAYGLSLAMNADGWKGTAIVGRCMVNGKWISQSIEEGSIWFGAKGEVTMSYIKPAFTPINVVSGAKIMIDKGVIQKAYADDFIAARQSVGLMTDGKTLVIVTVEGIEGQFGVTEKALADYLLTFGFAQAMEMDSGGSTTVLSQFADYHSDDPARQTINQLGFK